MDLFAHSIQGTPTDDWEPLLCHLQRTATLAECFSKPFGAASLGATLGWLHDLGKVKPDFQAKLFGEQNLVSHSGEGARYAYETFDGGGPGLGKMLAYCIAGHHAGLANGLGRSEHRPTTPLKERLASAEKVSLPEGMTLPARLAPVPLTSKPENWNYSVQFLTRMLFSALVDADFIATEGFYQPQAPRERSVDLEALRAILQRSLAKFPPPESDVNRLRAEVLQAAGDRATEPPGLFSLTVPTGGGKTLSSLRFALDHALAHSLRRVIYVVPFTAIIEQTADVFREALGDEDAVLEHHSSFDFDSIQDETQAERMKVAAQNWDRPIVVTTAVQFFESLYANRTQKCRKLHNIAQSVVVLDEAQALPIKMLRPCLAALNELARGYSCSVVFCTATQPAIWRETGLAVPEAPLQADTREIAPDPGRLYDQLRRVEVSQVGQLSNLELAERVRGRRALVIVNNKRQARALFDLLRDDGALHLSTNMTAEHRRDILAQVRAEPQVPLIATALVEAGVDLDFPEVWRAVAGLDSIVQAAGRCNRNGRMAGKGQVYVFEPEDGFAPPPELQRNADVAASVLRQHPDPLRPEAITAYFRQLYWNSMADLDANGIMTMTGPAAGNQLNFPFADIAAQFKMIEDYTQPLVIGAGPYGLDEESRKMLDFSSHAGAIARRIQRYTVQINPRVRNELVRLGAAEFVRAEEFGDQFVRLTNERLYDSHAGFSAEDPEDLGFRSV